MSSENESVDNLMPLFKDIMKDCEERGDQLDTFKTESRKRGCWERIIPFA